eukprot:GHVU01213536.1.p1 GENE.GHVU01213536.1~~GHVU01213536.1.p1  ORF type:complete len:296 (+),score=33.01 GHVU01213536.1:41-928(+)
MCRVHVLSQVSGAKIFIEEATTRKRCADLVQMVGVMKNVAKGLVHFEVVLDKWPNFTAAVCRPDKYNLLKMPVSLRNIWYFYAENPETLETFLRQSDLLEKQEKFYSKAIPVKYIPVMKKLLEENGGSLEEHKFGYFMEFMNMEKLEQAYEQLKPLYPHITCETLRETDSKIIYKSYPFQDENTEELIKFCYTNFPSNGAFVKDECIGWGHCFVDGTVINGYVHPDYRGTSVVMFGIGYMVKQLIKSGENIAYGFVFENNPAAIKMQKKIGSTLDDELCKFVTFYPRKPATNSQL